MPKNYFKIIPAVYLVLRDGSGRVLLMRRANTGYQDGKYSLPAGHIDGDETLYQAMAREAAEEIGIDVNPNNLQLVHVQHRRSSDPDLSNERVDFYFSCTSWKGEVINNEPEKCSQLSWLEESDIASSDEIIDCVKLALQSVTKGQIMSTDG